jgi:hypothetical protein
MRTHSILQGKKDIQTIPSIIHYKLIIKNTPGAKTGGIAVMFIDSIYFGRPDKPSLSAGLEHLAAMLAAPALILVIGA